MIVCEYYKDVTGAYYKPDQTLKRGLAQKKWFDSHRNSKGLVDFDFQSYYKKGYRNFIDHAGLGMHNAPHPGLDRDGTSCPLNILYYNYTAVLARIASVCNAKEAASLSNQAETLAKTIKEEFYDGKVFHDTIKKDGSLSKGTSWHSNGFAVYFDIIKRDEAMKAMQVMLDHYDQLCRGTPYAYNYFIYALRKVGMEQEAVDLIRKDWGEMLDKGGTTAWETFLGDELDSLCHPWSSAPFLFLMESPLVEKSD